MSNLTSQTILENFSKNIKYLRERYGWTQIELAHKLGYTSFATVSKWESAISMPRKAALLQIESLFGVTAEDLFHIDLQGNRGTSKGKKIEENSGPIVNVYSDIPGGIFDDKYVLGIAPVLANMDSQYYVGFRVSDDFMSPTVECGDTVIVRTDGRIRSGKLHLVCEEGAPAKVRRLTVAQPGGEILVTCDNWKLSEDLFYLSDRNGILNGESRLIGPVVEIRRRCE